ncbi:hypothetical protein Tco_1477060 [Tanacetum coccineum]
MAGSGSSHVVAKRAIDEIVEFSGETETPKSMKVNVMIVDMEAMNDPDEYLDSLMCLKDSRRMGNDKLLLLNESIAGVEEEISTLEAHLEIIDCAVNIVALSVNECLLSEVVIEWISLSKKRRLVAELEALGERRDAARSLKHMREIVARDSVTLGDLEQLLARAQVEASLKAGYVAHMEEKK